MPKVPVYNQDAELVGEIELSEAIFGLEPNTSLMHEVVLMYLANQRRGTHSTKTRAEVAGGGRKPWRQKGTGRARQGSIRAPHWRKGGVAFGPRPREYGWQMPKRARRLALRQALSSKVQDGELVVLEGYNPEVPKTKAAALLLQKLTVRKALFVTADGNLNVYKSVRNIPGCGARSARDLNTYEVLNAAKLILLRDAVPAVEEVLA